MPFQLITNNAERYLLCVGRCRHSLEPGYGRYIIISLRGDFTMNEALNFIAVCLISQKVPYHGAFFQGSLAVNTMGMSVQLPLAPKWKKIKYYIDHSGVPRLISQYEWNICRHDVHQFVAPTDRTRQVFGDYMTPAEQAQALQAHDLLQVVRISRP